MFQRILVPLDGSLRAERALPLAARLARASQGMLVLLRVVGAASADEPASTSQPPFLRTTVQTPGDEAQQYLTALASSQEFAGIPLTVAALAGPVVATIQTALHTYQADLLVLCAPCDPRGQSPLIGGLAGQLIEHLTTPLLLLPEHGPLPLTAHAIQPHPLTVLVAYDGLQPAPHLVESATSLLTALAGPGPRHLHLVPAHSSGSQPGTSVFSKQGTDSPVSIAGSERGNAKTIAVFRKASVLGETQEHTEYSNNADLLVLEIPAKPKRSGRLLDENRASLLSMSDLPLLLVPALMLGQS